jgi:hypothetical protein
MNISSYSLSPLTKFVIGTILSLIAVYLYILKTSVLLSGFLFGFGFLLQLLAIFNFYQFFISIKNKIN